MKNNELNSSFIEPAMKSLLTTEVITSLVHDLKTPLTSIKGFNQLIKNHPFLQKSKIIHYNELIDKNSDRLHAAIMNLVDLLGHNKKHMEEVKKDE